MCGLAGEGSSPVKAKATREGGHSEQTTVADRGDGGGARRGERWQCGRAIRGTIRPDRGGVRRGWSRASVATGAYPDAESGRDRAPRGEHRSIPLDEDPRGSGRVGRTGRQGLCSAGRSTRSGDCGGEPTPAGSPFCSPFCWGRSPARGDAEGAATIGFPHSRAPQEVRFWVLYQFPPGSVAGGRH